MPRRTVDPKDPVAVWKQLSDSQRTVLELSQGLWDEGAGTKYGKGRSRTARALSAREPALLLCDEPDDAETSASYTRSYFGERVLKIGRDRGEANV